jgi:hypothetical protein
LFRNPDESGGFPSGAADFADRPCGSVSESALKPVIPAAAPLAFTIAPHLQLINYRGCFSPFVGI